jgi:hypothetical protein
MLVATLMVATVFLLTVSTPTVFKTLSIPTVSGCGGPAALACSLLPCWTAWASFSAPDGPPDDPLAIFETFAKRGSGRLESGRLDSGGAASSARPRWSGAMQSVLDC